MPVAPVSHSWALRGPSGVCAAQPAKNWSAGARRSSAARNQWRAAARSSSWPKWPCRRASSTPSPAAPWHSPASRMPAVRGSRRAHASAVAWASARQVGSSSACAATASATATPGSP